MRSLATALVLAGLCSPAAAQTLRCAGIEVLVGGPQAAERQCPNLAVTGRASAPKLLVAPASAAPQAALEHVPPRLQQQRDSDRLKVLQQELTEEVAYSAGLAKSGADPAAQARSQANLVALRKEIGRTGPALR